MLNKILGTVFVGTAIVLAIVFAAGVPLNLFM
jgi:cell division protein FtsW (lipid II flippase)